MLISERGEKLFKQSEFMDNILRTQSNLYDKGDNPKGIINLGVAESVLSYDLMVNEIKKIQKNKTFNTSVFGYGDFTGFEPHREAMSKFYNKFVIKKDYLKSSDVVFANGGGTVIESFGYFLCEEKEKILISSPLYLAFENDFFFRNRVNVERVTKKKCKNGNLKYEFNFEEIESKIKKDKAIKSVVICNPHNPTGDIFGRKTLEKLIEICCENEIHLISDEVYALSTLRGNEFVSIFSVIDQMKDKKAKEKAEKFCHVIYSLSKDWGLNGFRVGVVFSKNKKILDCFRSCSYVTSCSFYTLELIKDIFEDVKFLEDYVKENQRRLTDRFEKVQKDIIQRINSLKKNYKPICEYVDPKATMFFWFRFEFLDTFEKEKNFFNELLDGGVYLARGFYFGSTEPGFFRLSYTGQDFETVKLAWLRIEKIVLKWIK